MLLRLLIDVNIPISLIAVTVLSVAACGPQSSAARTDLRVGETRASIETRDLELRRIDLSVNKDLRRAVRFLGQRVGVPVALPMLPPGAGLAPDPLSRMEGERRSGWVLHLTFGGKRHLLIQYGLGEFDGCGGDSARPVLVGDEPGLLSSSTIATWSELIWPATHEHPTGTYGLTGPFSGPELLAMALSMQTRSGRSGPPIGC